MGDGGVVTCKLLLKNALMQRNSRNNKFAIKRKDKRITFSISILREALEWGGKKGFKYRV